MVEIGVSILAGSFPAVAGSGTDRIYAAGLSGVSAASGLAVSSHALGEKYLSIFQSLHLSLSWPCSRTEFTNRSSLDLSNSMPNPGKDQALLVSAEVP